MGTYDLGSIGGSIGGSVGGAALGAQSAANGLGSGLKALAMGASVNQQAEQNTALILAKIFANEQSGNQHGAQAKLLAKKLEDINAVQNDPARSTPVSQSYFAVSGDAPYQAIGNTGRSLNKVTGQQIDAGTLAKIYDSVESSKALENHAQAGAARALMQQRLNLANTSNSSNGAADASGLPGDVSNLGNLKLNENQGNALIYGARARTASSIIDGLTGNYSPAMVNTKLYADEIPIVGGALAAGANTMMSPSDQKAEQAQRDMINAFMRRESGATISPQEFTNAKKQYIPQPGDSREVLAQKRANRELAIDGLTVIAGPAGNKVKELSDKALETGKSPAPDRKAILLQAKQAIAQGADRKAVIAELRSNYGIESAGF